ncbi:GNAT family N-acetyltransferase [Sinirhodobacter huangdaonensis]|uniref:GNAT family N-acetyltransferase n=1 Tax=Paenirhodobacter huangdaonensis TaxID=2501515 RepID=A0A443LXW6_9RHOB|nr:GNAT family N-acetyltransferase [Sinirhodobacter huangdaonensis]RWR54062.1 GNAT family N-acetyltransferase [Sinirhodobacter huangdaonensis]
MITITLEHPVQEELARLHARHTEAMHADTPPGSIHMLPADALAAPGILFYVMREEGRPIGMGALKRIDAAHAEIKSMHVLYELRGRGLARMLLGHLVTEARTAGYSRLSLETGSQDSFAPARGLYLAAGFETCPPFEGYRLDPMSVFMTIAL